jgi:hypothetical protein
MFPHWGFLNVFNLIHSRFPIVQAPLAQLIWNQNVTPLDKVFSLQPGHDKATFGSITIVFTGNNIFPSAIVISSLTKRVI